MNKQNIKNKIFERDQKTSLNFCLEELLLEGKQIGFDVQKEER